MIYLIIVSDIIYLESLFYVFYWQIYGCLLCSIRICVSCFIGVRGSRIHCLRVEAVRREVYC